MADPFPFDSVERRVPTGQSRISASSDSRSAGPELVHQRSEIVSNLGCETRID
jgi:hypothetical protein